MVINYYLKSREEKEYYENNINLGDEIIIEGTLNIPSSNTLPNTFNYKKYLYNQKIYYIVKAIKIEKIKNNNSVLYEIKNIIIKRINRIDNKGYIMTFILGNKDMLDEDVLEIYRENGISHLFSVSGMHIGFITGIIMYLLNKGTYNLKYKYFIMDLFLIFYSFLTSFTASIMRATINFILSGINKTYNLKIGRVDIILLTLVILCIINPFILYDIGFQFSYITSSALIIFSKKIKNKILGNFYSSFVCFLVSIPICIYYFYQINFISCLFNVVMIPFVSIVVFPLSIIVFIFPKLIYLYDEVISLLELINLIINKINFLTLIFPKMNIVSIIILYFVIYFAIKRTKWLIVLLISLIILKYNIQFNDTLQVITINVGQGDSGLMIFPNNRETILIDTGGISETPKENWQKRKNKYYLTDTTIQYLKSQGINDISFLVITHGDFDHMGEAINLVNNFKVEKVIFNCGPYNDLEKELIKVLNKKKIKYYSCIKELNIDKNKLYFLQTKEYDNENDNSNVIYTELNGYKFMFMGDASVATEKEILNKYNLPDIDVLKIGHHGSKTSSSKEFVNEINPKYSIISVGKNNRYGHPNKEVLNTLEDSKIYRTDEDGSIMFKINNDRLKIETCSPQKGRW